jgi:hypothetical protein
LNNKSISLITINLQLKNAQNYASRAKLDEEAKAKHGPINSQLSEYFRPERGKQLPTLSYIPSQDNRDWFRTLTISESTSNFLSTSSRINIEWVSLC